MGALDYTKYSQFVYRVVVKFVNIPEYDLLSKTGLTGSPTSNPYSLRVHPNLIISHQIFVLQGEKYYPSPPANPPLNKNTIHPSWSIFLFCPHIINFENTEISWF